MSKTFFFEEWQSAIATEVKAFFYTDEEGRVRFAGGPGGGGGTSGGSGGATASDSNAATAQAKAQIFNGTDAPFKRDKDGVYRSENGLEVRLQKIGSNTYARIFHSSSDSLVHGFTNAPVRSVGVVLEAARNLGKNINFNLPYDAFKLLESDEEVGKQMRRAISSMPNVYK
jgi:hypothetical protein